MAASVKAIIVAALVCGAGAERVRRARERGVRSAEAAAAVADADGATAAGAYGATAAAANAAAAQQQIAPLQLLQLRMEEHAVFGGNVIEAAGDGAGARADAMVPHVADNRLNRDGESRSGEGGANPNQPAVNDLPLCDLMLCELLRGARSEEKAPRHSFSWASAARAALRLCATSRARPPLPRTVPRRPAIPHSQETECIQQQPPVQPAMGYQGREVQGEGRTWTTGGHLRQALLKVCKAARTWQER